MRISALECTEGFFFVSGEIERVTSYEAGFVGHHMVRDGHTDPPPRSGWRTRIGSASGSRPHEARLRFHAATYD
jgi:hypothetical protein